MSRRLHRRTLLRGAAGIAVALPLLDAMLPRRARAADATPPLRFGVFFSSNGVIDKDWTPQGGEKDFTLSTTLAPLAPHKQDIVIIKGLNNETSYLQEGNPHDLAMAHMLTGMRMKGSNFGRAGHILDGTAGGPSVDQALAKAIGNDTKLRSLELGVESTISDLEPMVTRMSYGGPNDPRTPLDDPKQVFFAAFCGHAHIQGRARGVTATPALGARRGAGRVQLRERHARLRRQAKARTSRYGYP